MTKLPPLCRLCGKPIGKRTRTIYFGEKENERDERFTGRPISIDQVRKYTNGIVASVRWCRRPLYQAEQHGEFIDKATIWDGESYVDEFFCNQSHAVTFAYAHAKAGAATVKYNEAHAAQWAATPEGQADALAREQRAQHRAMRDGL